MLTLVLSVLFATAVETPKPLEVGTRLEFQGSVALRNDDSAGRARKTFDLTLWITKSDHQNGEMFWLVDERGQGAWPWSERFGRLTFDSRWRPTGRGPSIVYDRGDGRAVVPIVLPLLTPRKKMAPGVKWKDGDFEYQVETPEKDGPAGSWLVTVRNGFGTKRTLSVDRQTPLVVAMNEKVVMNKGKEYDLHVELVAREKTKAEDVARLSAALSALVDLRNHLNQALDSQEVEWKPAQLALLREQLPRLEEVADGTPIERIVASAKRDVELQTSRSGALDELARAAIGKAAAPFSIARLGEGPPLTDGDLRGHVTVLHFWDYRDEPLKEPYGQVGYIDFLHNRRKDPDLQIFGVAVDGRLADEASRPAATRSVRKLREFMNLGYPILLDGGELLKAFGDPRLVGGTLPLVVVLDRSGKIVHYHVGFYAVDMDKGLKALDEVVARTLLRK